MKVGAESRAIGGGAELLDGDLRLVEHTLGEQDLALRRAVARDDVHKTPGRQFRVAGHVPQRCPAQRASERVFDRGQVIGQRLHRPFVEANLRERQIVVVDEHQVRHALALQLAHRRPLAVDVQLDPAAPDDPTGAIAVVEPDRDAVRPERRVLRHRGLLDRERGIAFVTDRDLRPQRVHPGRLQPFVGELRHIASRGTAQAVEKVLERRVAPLVAAEVVLHAALECVVTHPRHQLSEHSRSLVVRDAVEVHPHRIRVGHVVGDRVRRDELILPGRHGLHRVGEVDPRIGETSGAEQPEIGHVRGERLIQPQVTPPAHGRYVAEAVHMRHLMQDRLRSSCQLGLTGAAPEDVRLVERDAPGVLHRPHVELGHEELVVLVEWVWETEIRVKEVQAGTGYLEDLERLLLDPLHQRFATPDGDGDAAMRALDHVIRPADYGDEIRWQRRCRVEPCDGVAIDGLAAEHLAVAAESPR